MQIFSVRRAVLAGAALALIPALAQAANPATTGAGANSDSLTYDGVTLYGVVDVGGAYQSHGVKLSNYFPPGLEYVVSKNSGGSLASLAPNALSQSKVGLKASEPITGDISLVAQVETQFVPTSLKLADALKSLTTNNGRALADQSANGDSSKTGQVFAGQAWVGFASRQFGTLTYGRVYSLFLDDVLAYDPMNAAHAFSVVGYQGAAQAGASTEDARLDGAVKYALTEGPVHVVGVYEVGNGDRPSTRAYQADIGYVLKNGSIDLTYGHVSDSVSAGTLTAAQVLTAPANSISATVSDNNAIGVFARYSVMPKFKVFFGYEMINYANPKDPLVAGNETIGGYAIGVVNNAAYPRDRRLDYVWAGARYTLTPRIDLTLAYYEADQNSYGLTSCSNSSSSKCSGRLQALSTLVVFKLVKRWDLYAGAMYSRAFDGLANGYLHNTSVDPTAGVRFTF